MRLFIAFLGLLLLHIAMFGQDVIVLRSGNFNVFEAKGVFEIDSQEFVTHNNERGTFGLGITLGGTPKNSEHIKITKYTGSNQYYVWVGEKATRVEAEKCGFSEIYALQPSWKIAPELVEIESDSSRVLEARCFTFLNLNNVKIIGSLQEKYQILEVDKLTNSVTLSITADDLQELADLPWFYWVEPSTPELELNNLVERTNHRVPVLEGPTSTYKLNGKNVVVGEWDGSGAQLHIDYDYRHTQVEPFTSNRNGQHATHVAGTVLGAGIIDAEARGMAPEATLISYDFRGNIPLEMDSAAIKYGIELTQNSYSYGSSYDVCSIRGSYDGTSVALDQLTVNYDYLLHVFAAGNSRGSNCLSGGYGTVHSGFQASKNSISVGALTRTDGNSSFHSYGPVKDGRLKPEICGVGVSVYSTFPFNSYRGGYSGTSMACPGVSGVAALIHQLYEDSTSNQMPAHLLKGSLCNGADELGRSGPDYQYGFGRVNADRTAKIIADKNYVLDSVRQNGVFIDTLYVAKNLTELKILLCWNDPAASPSASSLLVNDLDLEVQDSAGNVLLPWVLDAANYTSSAQRARDSLNPLEQVTLVPNSPYYIIKVRGKRITSGAQEFSINWITQDTALRVIYPNGGEQWVSPSSNANAQIIRWDSYGLSGTTSVEFSADSGRTWTTLASAVPANRTYYAWNNANADLATPGARIRVTKQGWSDVSDTVYNIGAKGPTPSAQVCSNQIHLSWAATTGARRYHVYRLDSGQMRLFDTAYTPFYTMRNLQNDSSYWVAIGVVDSVGAEGPRSNAVRFVPNDNIKPVNFVKHPVDTQLCQGSVLQLDVAVSGSLPIVLEWEESADNGVSWFDLNNSTASFTKSPMDIRDNNHLYRVKGVNQCLDTVYSESSKVLVDTALQFNMAYDTISLCLGQDTLVKTRFSASNTPLFMWYYKPSINGLISKLSDSDSAYKLTNVAEIDEGFYGVQLSNTCGNSGSPQYSFVEIRPSLDISNSSTDTFCVGAIAELEIDAVGGNGDNYTFWWTSEEDTVKSKRNVYYPQADKTWYANVFDFCSEDTVTKTIDVVLRDSLRLSLGPDTTLCKGQSYTIQAIVEGGRSSTYDYIWVNGRSNNSTVTVDSFNSKVYQLRFTDRCSADTLTDEVVVTIREALELNIVANVDTACHQQEFALEAKATGGLASGYNVIWTDGHVGFKRTEQLSQNTTYSATLTDGCTPLSATDSFMMSVRLPLSVSIAGPDTMCYGQQELFNAIPEGGDANQYRFEWNGSTGTSSYTVAMEAGDTLRLRLMDNCTPLDADTFTFVHVLPPLSSVSIDSALTICKGEEIAIGFFPAGGRSDAYTIRWAHSSEGLSTIRVNPLDTTVYVYTLGDGCSNPEHTDSIHVFVRPSLSLNLGEDIQKCAEDEVQIDLRGQGGVETQYRYVVNGLPYSSTSIVLNDTATEVVIVELLDDCTEESAKDTLTATVVPLEHTEFNLEALDHLTVALNTSVSPNEVEIRWGDGSSTAENSATLQKAYMDYGVYEVCKTELDNIGCTKTTCKEINVYNPFMVQEFQVQVYPNPVGDENLRFRTDRIFGEYVVRLMDSKGRIVFEKSGENTSQKEFLIPMNGVASGYYILEARLNEKPYRYVVVRE